MGAIGGLLGLSGGASGTGFAGPAQAPIQQGVNLGQVGQANTQSQQALQQQQRLLQALQGQGGIANQSQVYGQLQDVAAGRGPNPAQAMLAQQTGANAAQTAALMAGQRGAGANVGLLARQAGQTGANLQQQAVGQGATMQANQSLNAIGQAGQLANTQAANQIGATGAVTGAQQAQQANLLNALGQQNQAQVSSQGNVNQANASLANTGMAGQQAIIGGIMNNIGGAAKLATAGAAQGGEVRPSPPPAPTPQPIQASPSQLAFSGAIKQATHYADGGDVGPQSEFGRFLTGVSAPSGGWMDNSISMAANTSGADQLKKGVSSLGGGASSPGSTPSSALGGARAGETDLPAIGMVGADGGMVPVMVSPGEKILSPDEARQAASGGKLEGKTVPGKASVKGDSLKNDKVPANLPPGTIIIKRSRVNDNPRGFVNDVMAKHKGGRK